MSDSLESLVRKWRCRLGSPRYLIHIVQCTSPVNQMHWNICQKIANNDGPFQMCRSQPYLHIKECHSQLSVSLPDSLLKKMSLPAFYFFQGWVSASNPRACHSRTVYSKRVSLSTILLKGMSLPDCLAAIFMRDLSLPAITSIECQSQIAVHESVASSYYLQQSYAPSYCLQQY